MKTLKINATFNNLSDQQIEDFLASPDLPDYLREMRSSFMRGHPVSVKEPFAGGGISCVTYILEEQDHEKKLEDDCDSDHVGGDFDPDSFVRTDLV